MTASPAVPITPPRRRRPTPVTILAAIQTVIGVANLGVAIVLFTNANQGSPLIEALIDRSSFKFVDPALLPLALATIGLLDLAAAGLLLQVRRLGWTLAMLLAGFTLTVLVVTYATGGKASTFALLLNVVAVLYLNASQTRAAFGLVPASQIALEDAPRLMVTDVELLRRYEPVVKYTRGEFFFPMAVDPYLRECDLWAEEPDGDRRLLVRQGALSVEELGDWQSRAPESRLFLRYVQHPLSGIELSRSGRPKRDPFRAPSRLSRVGIVARLIDAGFDLSLLVRGTVPGGTVAAADVKYDATRRGTDPDFHYHGRVVRQAGWTICHYLFFYAMNDWRSSFAGANDHEADWEQCFVFLETDESGAETPVWFARAAHDEVGADLRRRWDDPIVQKVGEHPVIFAGAGSHAAYIEPGEYLQEVPLKLPRALTVVLGAIRDFWTVTLRQGTRAQPGHEAGLAAVPFIDYARGDGVAIGPEQPAGWNPILIDDDTPWVSGFDGLFGLDTKDRFAGERAPAGPKFNRDGRPRQSWIDPVGFAGLETTPPPSRHADVLEGERVELVAELTAARARIAEAETNAQELGARVLASQRAGRSEQAIAPLLFDRDAVVTELTGLRRQAEELRTLVSDTTTELERVRAGDLGDPRAHLRFVAHPQDPSLIARSRVLDVWASISAGAAIFLIGVLLVLGIDTWWIGLPAIILGYVGIEALVRRRFLALLLNVTALLAAIGALILLREFFIEALAVAVFAIGVVILRDNVRELRAANR